MHMPGVGQISCGDRYGCKCRAGGELLLVRTAGSKKKAADWRIPGADVGVFDSNLTAVATQAAERQLGSALVADAKGAVVVQCASPA